MFSANKGDDHCLALVAVTMIWGSRDFCGGRRLDMSTALGPVSSCFFSTLIASGMARSLKENEENEVKRIEFYVILMYHRSRVLFRRRAEM